MASPDDYRRFLDPKLLGAVANLEFKTRKIVEGVRLGLHRSPYHGVSVEFAEHREYVPGDDVRHLDWKIYAKRDRFFVKQYEEETNLAATFLLDVSTSMNYRSAGGLSKADYGKYLVAAISYMLTEQQDAVGLVTFDQSVLRTLPPKSSGPHFRALCKCLEESAGGPRTDLGNVLHRAAAEIDSRGVVVVVSDLLDDAERVLWGLGHLAHGKHEVVVLHVMDGDELEFPFSGAIRFDDLEGGGPMTCDGRDLRRAYLDEVSEHCDKLRAGCRHQRIDYVLMDTRQPLDVAVTSYLNTRAKRLR